MLVIGSRGSLLALWQAQYIQERLEARGIKSRIEIIKTTGDAVSNVPLNEAGKQTGTKGLFTKEIEEALLGGQIDLAVHSLKDLPTELPPGLTIAATPERQSPFDALVGKRLSQLGPGARVGTSSLRRSAQLRRLRPDLVLESIRGNVDTRLRKLDEGRYDAVVLAAAGLNRLGLSERIAQVFPPEAMCPAVGQGALAIETREGGEAFDICAPLDHPWTRLAITAERALLAALGGGCQVPIGAYADVEDDELHLTATVIAPDGSRVIHAVSKDNICRPVQLGRQVGATLLAGGAREILDIDATAAVDSAV